LAIEEQVMRTPKGFRNISTTYQVAYQALGGGAQVRQIGSRLWEVLDPGNPVQYATSKKAALDLAYRFTFHRPREGR
jgi:hypothetical protein